MLLATIVCSDPDCDAEHELAIRDLNELDGLACECGYGYVLVAVADLREPGGEVISLAERRLPPDGRRRAA